MVIVNPRLSLPSDLPYKTRQGPFFPNTPLQQATIRYNEAIRKKYNDIQFAKRLENGSGSQNETTGVNTIDIAKMVDPLLFLEMSNMSPANLTAKKRKSKPLGHILINSVDRIGTNCRSRHAENARQPSMNSLAVEKESFPPPHRTNSCSSNYDCNSTEMFPHLQSTVNTEGEKNCNTPYYTTHSGAKPPSSSSLESQAINEYKPTIDSAHDMIFGNVMGMDYGNYIHGPLWTPQQQQLQQQQQQQQGYNGNNVTEQPQHYHSTPPSLCCSPKLTHHGGGYIQPPTTMHAVSSPAAASSVMYDINANENGTLTTSNPLPVMGKQGGPSGRRSTSVPRPRTGTQKETLKQAAIRCGIIKGNHTVAAIPKRSQCLVPLNLTPVQSDPVVSVVEILHPKGTIPACSSEALVGLEDFTINPGSSLGSNCSEAFVIHNNRSTPALNIGTGGRLDNCRMTTEKCNSDGHSQAPTDSCPAAAIRTLENATLSCPTL